MMSTAEREDAIAAQLPLVRRIARRHIRTAPSSVDVGDLESIGTIGLTQAASRYDASKGASFATFVGRRIRGAILDQMRSEALLTRDQHAAIKPGDPFVRPLVTFSSDVAALAPHPTADPIELDPFLPLRIRRALLTLPRRDRLVIVWRVLHERKQSEIALRLGLSTSRVHQLEYRAIERLRVALAVAS